MPFHRTSLREAALAADAAETARMARRAAIFRLLRMAECGLALRRAIRDNLGAACPDRIPVRFDGEISPFFGVPRPSATLEGIRFVLSDGDLYAEVGVHAGLIDGLASLGSLLRRVEDGTRTEAA